MGDNHRNIQGQFARWKYQPVEDPTLSHKEQAAKWEEYFDALALYGEYARAAESVEYSPLQVARFRRHNPWFQAFCDDAIGRHTSVLIEEANRRAIEGSERKALGGKNRDQLFTVETVYSDHLMTLALKRKDPSFRDTQQVEIAADVNLASMFDYKSMSKRARAKLRELLEILAEDAEARENLDAGTD